MLLLVLNLVEYVTILKANLDQ